MQVSASPILVHFAGHDIYYTTHGIRTVEYRCRTTQYLHPVGQKRLVGIGNRVPENAGILWVPINKNHQAGIAAAQSAQGDTACRSVRDTVAHHAARSGEQPRNLFREHREQGGLHRLLDSSPVHH